MKRILFLAAMCCFLGFLPANAGDNLRYVKYGNCKLIVNQRTAWLGCSATTYYGLAVHGMEVLEPYCDNLYENKEVKLLAFRRNDPSRKSWMLYIYSADTGKCLFAERIHNKRAVFSFEKSSDGYVRCMVRDHYRKDRDKCVGTFIRKGGKTYQIKTKEVTYEAPLH